MPARIAYTGNHIACIAPSVWGVLFVLPEEDNTRLGCQARCERVGGRHRRRR